MTRLSETDLDFAREHISKYYDSDFFPKPIDFDALWFNWEEVKSDLISKNIKKISVSTPRVLAAPKPGITYRVVHQLDPIDALVYTAMVASICEQIETARPSIDSRIACSYRILKRDGSFFASGAGYREYSEKTEELAFEFTWVLSFDISDFYNQIYLHRLKNAIEYVDPSLTDVADDIETFITSINSKASQGVPVGPAASIVLAEAVLLDVDSFISSRGLKHTRYVDDFRVFSDNKRELADLLERVTVYLYQSHRLSIATEKTALSLSSDFVDSILHSDEIEERDEILDELEGFNPYSQYSDDDENDVEWDWGGAEEEDEEDEEGALVRAAERLLKSERLDLGLARAVIRTARRNRNTTLAGLLIENLYFFSPVAADLFIYLDAITDVNVTNTNRARLEKALEEDFLRNDFINYWFIWYIARHVRLFDSAKLRNYIYKCNWLELTAIAAVEDNNLPWIRALKNKLSDHSPRERRAIIYASKILPSDERTAWLKNVMSNSANKFDLWMANWVMAGAPEAPL